MKAFVVEVSSGFANVANSVIWENCYGSSLQERSGSAYDRKYCIEIPEGFAFEEIVTGEKALFHGDKIVDLCSVNHTKNWVTACTSEGFFHFKIIDSKGE